MTDRHRSPKTGDDRDMVYDRESSTGIPRWARVGGITVAVVALMVIVMMLIGGGGGHGPGRHGPGDSGEQAPPSSVHVPPKGGHG